jgi:hypothetical protein
MKTEIIGAHTDWATVLLESSGTAELVFELFQEFQVRTEGNFEGWSLPKSGLQLVDDTIFFEAEAHDEATLIRKLNVILEFFKTCGGLVEFHADIAVAVESKNNVHWQNESVTAS